MNNKLPAILLIAMTLFHSCAPMPGTIYYNLHNDTDLSVEMYLPFWYRLRDATFHLKRRDMNLIDIRDTSFTTASSVLHGIFLAPYENRVFLSGYDSFQDMTPYDTVRCFVAEWRKLTQDYVMLVRYDLSIKDMELLKDNKGRLDLRFPPDERMKDIKMWPRYETFQK